jgi:ABC-2 type transport system ATP-binding protein
VIELAEVAARRSPLALSTLSLRWGPGIHAVVGASNDGGHLLLALIAGAARARTGRVRVLGGAPSDGAVRPQVAFIPLAPALPEAMRVGEVLAMAAKLRGEPPADAGERLRALGVETLAPRRIKTLSLQEARAVSLAEAVTSKRVRVMLIEEPFVALDPRAAALLPAVIGARSSTGCAIVIATASVRDASELADDYVLLRNGSVVGQPASLEDLARFAPDGVRLRILSSDARALTAALAGEEGVEAVARRDGTVVARGRDVLELTNAAGRAIVASGVDIVEMRIKLPSLDEVVAAAAGVAAAAYEAARTRTRAAIHDGDVPPSVSATSAPVSNEGAGATSGGDGE